MMWLGKKKKKKKKAAQKHSEAEAAAAAAAAPVNPAKEVPRTRLERYFNSKMKNAAVPLFKDFKTFVRTLPVRKYAVTGEFLRLCDLPFWAKDDDVAFTVEQLEHRDAKRRDLVKYAAAPSASGKTSTGLVAFLASVEKDEETSFTHYLYLAFENNNNENFGVADTRKLSDNENVAEGQGAVFAVECLKRLLAAKKGEKKIRLKRNPPSREATNESLKKLLGQNFPTGAQILMHVDEHRKMCSVRRKEDASAAFRRGCLETFANAEGVTVFATFTELPRELPSTTSSATCRSPVPVPAVDVNKVIESFHEFAWLTSGSEFDGNAVRLWATLKFRLGAKLTDDGLAALHRPNENFAELRRSFGQNEERSTIDEALAACSRLCALPPSVLPDAPDPSAIDLLLGIDDDAAGNLGTQIRDVVVIRAAGPSNKLTSSLRRLLTIDDKEYPVYSDGRDRIDTVLRGATDYLSATPLETSYAWTLSCRSARAGFLKFTKGSTRFDIKCAMLKAGRFFAGDDTTKYAAQTLTENVIYYVDEGPGKETHPLADLFFRTKSNEVVLIDVGGSLVDREILKKRNNLQAWIRQQLNDTEVTFYGVVLAPFVKGESKTYDAVTVVRGEDALQLLGGLRQVARWLEA